MKPEHQHRPPYRRPTPVIIPGRAATPENIIPDAVDTLTEAYNDPLRLPVTVPERLRSYGDKVIGGYDINKPVHTPLPSWESDRSANASGGGKSGPPAVRRKSTTRFSAP